MRKRTIVLLIAITLLLVGGLAAGVVLLVSHEPGFYQRCEVPAGKERFDLSKTCVGRLASLATSIGQGTQEWAVEISEAQLNSFFAEHFLKWGEAGDLKKKGISSPRLLFEPKKIRLAFRYGTPPWSTVISFDVRIWLAPHDLNVVAVEILGRHAGSLPISAKSLLDFLSEQARKQNIEVSWYRHSNNPVALVRFQADRRPTFQLRRIDLEQGKITVGGIALQDSYGN